MKFNQDEGLLRRTLEEERGKGVVGICKTVIAAEWGTPI
jgi:hypothetical protein